MFRMLVLPTLVAALALTSSAQMTGGATSPPPNLQPQPDTRPAISDLPVESLFISGKVAVDDETALTDRVAIQSFCKGRTHVEAYADSKGQFSFQVRNPNESRNRGMTGDASDSSSSMLGRVNFDTGRAANPLAGYLHDCQLRAVLPGFTSETIDLGSKAMDVGPINVGTLVLHRTAQVEGLTVSVTTAQAPSKAKKEYAKGRKLEMDEKWDAALERFRKAVAQYPNYAIAWFEIGSIQERKGDLAGAQRSFQQAIAADSKYVSPYHQLAQIALDEQKWQEAVNVTGQLLNLNPLDFPEDWLLNGAGNFHLKNFDAAEKSAVRGLEVDTQHKVPRLEYLLGMILVQKNDYSGALPHIRNFLRLAPHAIDAEIIQKQAEEIERLSAQARVDR